MAGTYDCVVTTCDGSKSVTSSPTRLTVFDAPEAPRPYLTWGENYGAQCGNGTNDYELPPFPYTQLTNIVQAEGGRSFSIALRDNGTVYTWGRTEGGELGNGSFFSNVHSPAQVAGLSNVVQVAAGNSHALALLRDGSIKAWGWNLYGQLGDMTQDSRNVPSPTAFPGCFVAIAAGHLHSLALRSDGTVWACGNSAYGTLGNGSTGSVNTTPTQVPGLTDVIAIRAAGYTCHALKSDGTVWAWGDNTWISLGDGTNIQRNTPVQVVGLTGVRAIASSYYSAYAIRSNGEAYAWGRGDMGALGNGSGAWQSVPTLIPGLTNPKKIESGDAGWAMALMQDGTLRAWGYNAQNVLNTGAPNGSYQYSHQPVLGVSAANNIGAGTSTAHVFGNLSGVTAVEDPAPQEQPLQLALRVTPTPSRSTASLAFDLPKAGHVTIGVYDIAGRLVQSVVRENRPAGRHVATWDGRSASGQRISSGVFLAKLVVDGKALTRRIILIP
jgi:alpha-tubulin suppressor-like RCC1 family protein